MDRARTIRPRRITASLLASALVAMALVLLNPHPARATTGMDQYHCPNYGDMSYASGVDWLSIESYYWRTVALLTGYHQTTGDKKYFSYLTDEAGDPTLPYSGDIVSTDWKFRWMDQSYRTCGNWTVQVSGTSIQTWGLFHFNPDVYDSASPARSCFNVGGNWNCTSWNGMVPG